MDNGTDGLIDLGVGESFGRYFAAVWERRSFLIVVPANDIRAQNMGSILGQFWHLLNPMLMAGVYYLIFGVVLDTTRGVSNYLGFLIIGVFIFQLTQRTTQDGAITIDRNKSLIRSISFPRILLPISSVNAQTIAFLPALFVMFVVVAMSGERFSYRLLYLVPILIMHYFINVGLACIAARIGSQMRDLSQVLPHLFRLLFYLSGVLFSVEAYVEDQLLRNLMALNPIYDIISCVRWSLMGLELGTNVVAGALCWAVILPLYGVFVFKKAERRYGA